MTLHISNFIVSFEISSSNTTKEPYVDWFDPYTAWMDLLAYWEIYEENLRRWRRRVMWHIWRQEEKFQSRVEKIPAQPNFLRRPGNRGRIALIGRAKTWLN